MLLEAIVRRFPAIERATGLRPPLSQRLKESTRNDLGKARVGSFSRRNTSG